MQAEYRPYINYNICTTEYINPTEYYVQLKCQNSYPCHGRIQLLQDKWLNNGESDFMLPLPELYSDIRVRQHSIKKKILYKYTIIW